MQYTTEDKQQKEKDRQQEALSKYMWQDPKFKAACVVIGVMKQESSTPPIMGNYFIGQKDPNYESYVQRVVLNGEKFESASKIEKQHVAP